MCEYVCTHERGKPIFIFLFASSLLPHSFPSLLLCDCLCCYRESLQNFEEVHSRLKRGDIVGVKGKPGEKKGRGRGRGRER